MAPTMSAGMVTCAPAALNRAAISLARRTRQLADLDLEHRHEHADRLVVFKPGRDPQHPAEHRASETRHQRFDVAHTVEERNDSRRRADGEGHVVDRAIDRVRLDCEHHKVELRLELWCRPHTRPVHACRRPLADP
jgi:hypothetical protein